jgi:signal transduction histidine kinase
MQYRWQTIEPALLANDVSESFLGLRHTLSVGLSYTVHVEPNLPNLRGDPTHLSCMLLELLSNAEKYTLQPKCISLTVAASAESVCFAVKDNGLGITADEVLRVFEPFYQVDRPQRYGCGVGLSVARKIVEDHGGTVQVESQLGVGSTFSVYLPRALQN